MTFLTDNLRNIRDMCFILCETVVEENIFTRLKFKSIMVRTKQMERKQYDTEMQRAEFPAGSSESEDSSG